MNRTKMTLVKVNEKINRLQRQVKELRAILFEWGKKDREDIDRILRIKEIKELVDVEKSLASHQEIK